MVKSKTPKDPQQPGGRIKGINEKIILKLLRRILKINLIRAGAQVSVIKRLNFFVIFFRDKIQLMSPLMWMKSITFLLHCQPPNNLLFWLIQLLHYYNNKCLWKLLGSNAYGGSSTWGVFSSIAGYNSMRIHSFGVPLFSGGTYLAGTYRTPHLLVEDLNILGWNTTLVHIYMPLTTLWGDHMVFQGVLISLMIDLTNNKFHFYLLLIFQI